MIDTSRVQKELVEIERDRKTLGVSIKLHGDDLTHLCGTIAGPLETPYEGGIFLIDIRLPGRGCSSHSVGFSSALFYRSSRRDVLLCVSIRSMIFFGTLLTNESRRCLPFSLPVTWRGCGALLTLPMFNRGYGCECCGIGAEDGCRDLFHNCILLAT